MEEIWKDIEGYEGMYQVSNLGRVRSLGRIVKLRDSFRRLSTKVLSPRLKHNGYNQVVLQKDGQRVDVSIHRLVGIAFIPNPENKHQINHKNGIKTDNRVENLEWCTGSENIVHADKTGLRIMPKGQCNSMAKLSESDVVEIRSYDSLISDLFISKKFQVSRQTINSIRNKKTWTHI